MNSNDQGKDLTLADRFVIHPDKPLPARDHAMAIAVEVTDRRAPTRLLLAMICRPGLIPRLDIIPQLARLMRLPGKGVIAEGMDADLLVLDDQMQVQHLLAGDRWHIKNGRQEIQGSYESVPTSNKPATGA